MSSGEAYKNGAPETLGEMTSPDPNVVAGIRRCALNATGLVSKAPNRPIGSSSSFKICIINIQTEYNRRIMPSSRRCSPT